MAKRSSCPSKIVRGASEDVISDLPKNLIDLILDALPLRDAVRTSVLSRKWQYRWFTISQLDFSEQFFKSLNINYMKTFRAKNIINKILLLHSGHIRKFTLQIPNELYLEDDVYQWLHFLSRNGIKELTLDCFGSDYHRLGFGRYSFLELTNLNIGNCEFIFPAAFKGFPNLTVLELFSVLVNPKFGDVISVCPHLKKVSMKDCCGLLDLVLRAPKLQYLCVEDAYGLKTIHLNGTDNLVSLSISLMSKEDNTPEKQMTLEKLCLGDTILEFSAATSMPKRLQTTLFNLKRIVISHVDFNNVAQIACILCLFRSLPKLSELDISAQEQLNTESPTQDISFVEDYGYDECFGQLRTVMLRDLRVLKAEMALIKLLLGHSPLLEQMKIMLADTVRLSMNKSLYMCKELMCFARASPKAELVYSDRFDNDAFI